MQHERTQRPVAGPVRRPAGENLVLEAPISRGPGQGLRQPAAALVSLVEILGLPMLDRRTFIACAAASGLVSTRGPAQPGDPRRYGLPAGTRPFGPEVYRERRRRLMERMKTGVAVVYGPAAVDRGATAAPIDRTGSDFTYLTGLVDDAGAALLLARDGLLVLIAFLISGGALAFGAYQLFF